MRSIAMVLVALLYLAFSLARHQLFRLQQQ
jgi:hypothetical protein